MIEAGENHRWDEAALSARAGQVAAALEPRGWQLATAESCTGGWVAKVCTDRAGSSGWFERGFVTYSNESKRELLGVSAEVLAAHGAVSEPVVRAMAAGALAQSRAEVVLAITGIAGPGGGSVEKPVGTVWLAWQQRGNAAQTQRFLFDGDRNAVRGQSVAVALGGLLAWMKTL